MLPASPVAAQGPVSQQGTGRWPWAVIRRPLGRLLGMGGPAAGAIAVVSVHASPLGLLGRGENGGMNLAIRRLCEGLADRGIPSDVFIRHDDPSAPRERLISPLSRLVALPVGPPEPLPKEAVAAHLDEFAAAVAAHAASERRAYRLVHGHYWFSGVVGRRLRTLWGVPWVQSFHTLSRSKERAGLPADPQRAAVEQQLVDGADRLIAMSKAEGRALVHLYDADRDRICVAEPGVDPHEVGQDRRRALREELGLNGRRVVLFAGRLEPLKGADTLIRALRDLSDDPSFSDVVALVIGDDSGDGGRAAEGGERHRLQRAALDGGLGERVRFLGAMPHEQLAAYYAIADVCVVPSRVETFGLVALEAAAQGTPVVAARVGGLPEVVAHGETGFLVEGQDSTRFAEAIATVLADEPLRTRMGRAAAARAEEFSWERMVDRLLAIYARVDGNGPQNLPCGYEVSLEAS